MVKNYFKVILVASLVLIAAAASADWVKPNFNPPSCPDTTAGCNTPLNVSGSNQTKGGGIVAGGLASLTNIVLKTLGYGIVSDTPDGADNKYVSLSGGGVINDHNRGASLTLFGNEFSFYGLGGSMLLKTGGAGAILFYTGATPTERMRVTREGNVGFGTSLPASKVDVVGDICWTPTGYPRRCLGTFDPVGSGGGGTNYWTQTGNDIKNNNGGQVQVAGKVKIAGGSPGTNKLLVGEDDFGLARWRTLSQVMTDTGTSGDGIGNDVLNTTFTGCIAGFGCPIRSGDAGPTQSHSVLDGVGTVTMTCPAGYQVVSGGADCDKSWNAIVAVQVAFLNASRPISKTQWQVQCTKLSGSPISLITTENASAIKKASITCAR